VIRRLVLLVPLALVVAGCGDAPPGPPPVPASVVAVSGGGALSGTVGAAVGAAPAFEVRAENGRAIRDVPVTVTVSSGGGSLAGAPTVSLDGPTPIGTWTLGATVGAQSVTVTVAGLAPLVFTATATAGAPAELLVVDGHNQFGVEGEPVGSPLRARVRDAFANPVAGAVVTWTVTEGGGSLAATTSTTDAEGIATSPAWTLGVGADPEQAVVASLASFTARFAAFTGLVPASVTVEVAAPATAPVGAALVPAPAFAVRDSTGEAITGFPVSVAVTAGGGALDSAPTATATGTTPIGTWTLGTVTGPQSVTVTVAGLDPVVFALDGVAAATATVDVVAGAGQSGLAGSLITTPPRVRVRDQYGNLAANRLVQWGITQGGGSLSAASSTTNAEGVATAPTWTLGRSRTPQQLFAISNGVMATVDATIQSDYRVELRFYGGEPAEPVRQAFENAQRRIEGAVIGDLQDILLTDFMPVEWCRPEAFGDPISGVLDDVMIFVEVDSIDGVGGVLGSAGPCYTRISDGLSSIGRMRFDRDDLLELLNAGRLEAVILHEMLHVIGIGTLWQAHSLLSGVGTSTVEFTGPLARDACINDHAGGVVCAAAVPVENCLDLSQSCGSGTINSHWKESVFANELMTGFLNQTSNPLSRMSIQSLADMGYQVNPLAADGYSLGANLMALRDDFGANVLVMPAPARPTHSMDRYGRVTPLPPM
jgi:hypothetical protein